MIGSDPKNEQVGALFLFGLVLFFPPMLEVFDTGAEVTVFGIPLLYFYLFLAWAVLIGLMAFVIERPVRGGERTPIPMREAPPPTD